LKQPSLNSKPVTRLGDKVRRLFLVFRHGPNSITATQTGLSRTCHRYVSTISTCRDGFKTWNFPATSPFHR